MSGVSGKPVVTTLVRLSTHYLPARLRVHWAPGIPHALFWTGETKTVNLARKTRGEIAELCSVVITREGG